MALGIGRGEGEAVYVSAGSSVVKLLIVRIVKDAVLIEADGPKTKFRNLYEDGEMFVLPEFPDGDVEVRVDSKDRIRLNLSYSVDVKIEREERAFEPEEVEHHQV